MNLKNNYYIDGMYDVLWTKAMEWTSIFDTASFFS
jgi:hypothetical protein